MLKVHYAYNLFKVEVFKAADFCRILLTLDYVHFVWQKKILTMIILRNGKSGFMKPGLFV